jgi:phosphoglycolate phosphatase-like HAD superfamily hydrolase
VKSNDSVDALRSAIQSSRGVVFDFDGTLVDSNEIKRRGFDFAFAAYPDRMAEIRAYCYSFNHTVRGEKFRHVTERILGLEYTPELDKLFHKRFAEFTTESVVAAAEIPGASDFVRRLVALRPALLSSTPTAILLEILQRRGWGTLFPIVQGAPVNKRDWLRDFQGTLGCRPEDVLFFGDTDEDAEAGRGAGCRFVRVGRAAPDKGELAIQDFTGL